MHKLFRNSPSLKNLVKLRSSDYSPVLHLRINHELRRQLNLPEGYGGPGSKVLKALKHGHEEEYFDEKLNAENYILQKVIDESLQSKVLITRSKRVLHHELLPVVPEIIIHTNAGFSKSEIEYAFSVIEAAIVDNLTGLSLQKFNQIANSLTF
ncbi:unnamed protein product [Ambrosiozyma monospora]|uniref:Unnamed protein product n=1 Tax=Ambrosiozyma monospora TaxID=43982 RepID=A0A9W6WHJ9_AMBMO|nr:unnamed protein product [Ambrosiozyma monospora]